MTDSGGEKPCNFFRKVGRKQNIRKRRLRGGEEEEEEDEEEDLGKAESGKVRRNEKVEGKLFFRSGAGRVSATAESSGNDSIFQFESCKEIQVEHDSKATATLETQTDFSRDARAIRERVLKQADDALKGNKSSSGGDKLYKGIHGYTDHRAGFRREQTISSEKAGGAHGPLRASAHIRVSARFDYQPDICKDYKETGYCGYGDSCKFMHDRGDYKSGWQLEKEWEEAEKARKRNLALGLDDSEEQRDVPSDDDEDDDELPFACFICRQPFVDPVVTKCKHYFCEHCALKHHAKNKKCFVCNKPTLGMFNAALEIKRKMAEQRT